MIGIKRVVLTSYAHKTIYRDVSDTYFYIATARDTRNLLGKDLYYVIWKTEKSVVNWNDYKVYESVTWKPIEAFIENLDPNTMITVEDVIK